MTRQNCLYDPIISNRHSTIDESALKDPANYLVEDVHREVRCR